LQDVSAQLGYHGTKTTLAARTVVVQHIATSWRAGRRVDVLTCCARRDRALCAQLADP
jgi:hypothetical protein